MVVPKFTFGSVSEVVSERHEEQGAERGRWQYTIVYGRPRISIATQ